MSNTLLMANSATHPGRRRLDLFRPAPQPQRFIRVTGLTKTQAEDLLDWLEANRYRGYQVSYAPERGFTVSWDREATA